MTEQVRVTVSVSGGLAIFPGRARPFTVDTSQLEDNEAQELAGLVDNILAIPEPENVPRPDVRTYEIIAERQGASRTIVASEPLSNPDLRALITFVQARRR